MVFLDLNSSRYSTWYLSDFGLLANTGITSTTPGTTTVNSGVWGSATGSTTGSILPVTSDRSGPLASTAQVGLTYLIDDISNNVMGLPIDSTLLPSYSAVSKTLYGNRIYTVTGAPGFNYSGGSITFDASGNPDTQFFIVTTEGPIEFAGVEFTLSSGAQPCNIFWLAGTTMTSAYGGASVRPIYGNFISRTSSTFTSSLSITGHIYSKIAVTITPNDAGTTINTSTCTDPSVVCYAKGTLILTRKGFVPIEKLKAGQSIITKGKIYYNKYHSKNANIKAETLLWVSKFKVVNLNSKSRPICIKKDALGENKPFKDLYVSPGHGLLLNGHMVRANSLINGTTIFQDNDCDDVVYYHIELDSHSAIFANGILSESYLAINNRDVFENSISLRIKPTHNLKNIQALR